MTPPDELDVIDRHGGFTIESKVPYYLKGNDRFDFEARQKIGGKIPHGDSLWRPGRVLKKSTTGILLAYDRNSFYQTNDDVTIAFYRVSGYGYPILVWFDNRTGERIA